MREQHLVEIARPPSEVFAFVEDSANAPRWAEGIVSITVTHETPQRVGSRYRMIVREGRKENAYEGEVVAWQKDRHRRETATRGGQTMTLDQSFEPLAGGRTRFVHAAEIDLKGFAVVFTPIVRLFLRRTLRKQAEKVKELLER